MRQNFEIYNTSISDYGVPTAAKEHLVTMRFHNQDNLLSTKDSLMASICGYMTNEFSYSSTGNYKNVWDITWTGDSQPAKLLSDETQRNIFNHGYATKKMFSNGESPSISISMTCYAGDNYDGLVESIGGETIKNSPVEIAQILIAATLPKVASDNIGNATNAKTFVKGALPVAKKVVSGTLGIASTLATKTATDGPVAAIGSGFDEAKTMLGKDFDMITSRKPPVCELSIGSIFKKDFMVVRKVDVTFSKEYISPGVPLYAKFELVFESLFNAANIFGKDNNNAYSIFGTGLLMNGRPSRVSFISKSDIAATKVDTPQATNDGTTYDPKATAASRSGADYGGHYYDDSGKRTGKGLLGR